jgi:hypothetical protein
MPLEYSQIQNHQNINDKCQFQPTVKYTTRILMTDPLK